MSARALNYIYDKAVSETFFTQRTMSSFKTGTKRSWRTRAIMAQEVDFLKGKVYSELEMIVKIMLSRTTTILMALCDCHATQQLKNVL